jgi:hypothetical protein
MYSDKFLSPLADTLLARYEIDFSRRQKELHRQTRLGTKVIDRKCRMMTLDCIPGGFGLKPTSERENTRTGQSPRS